MRLQFFLLLLLSGNCAMAQWEDDFSDGEFLTQPVWSGDTADFEVNPSGQLQLQAADAGVSNLFSALPLTSMDDVEWTFFIHLAFSPSSTNYARVYLAMNQPGGGGNGYFLQFGEALSNDAVQLFRQDGNSLVSVCRATDGQIASAFSLGVKVTRDASGVWTLSIDPSGGTRYQVEAFGAEGMYTACDWFGISCTYTSSNATKFYFDDFHIGSISTINTNEATAHPLDVLFNEVYFEPTSSATIPDAEFIELINRTDSVFYIDGWVLSDGTTNAIFPAYSSIAPGQFLIVTDVSDTALFNSYGKVAGLNGFPSLNNDVGDHLVLKDRSGSVIDEVTFSDETYGDPSKSGGGWTLERVDTSFFCPDPGNWTASASPFGGTPGAANASAGIFRDSQPPYADYGYVSGRNSVEVFFSEAVDTATVTINCFALTKEQDTLHLLSINKSGLMHVSLLFTDSIPAKTYTLHLSASIRDCSGNALLASHTIQIAVPVDVSADDLVVNELLFDAPDGIRDFIELYNRTDHAVDLSSVRVAETSDLSPLPVGAVYPLTTDHRLLFPGKTIAFSETPDAIVAHYPASDHYNVMRSKDLPDFNTIQGGVVVYINDGRTADWFPYRADMHFALIRDAKGISLERLLPDCPSTDITCWHSAATTVGYATPGAPNSQHLEGVDRSNATVSLSRLIISPDNNGMDDELAIRYHFNEPGRMASCRIFSEYGILFRNLVNNEMLGNEGQFVWDGMDDTHQPVPEGRYVIVLETFTLKGETVKNKSVCGVVYPD